MGGGDAPQFQIERRSSTKDCLLDDKSTVRLGLPTICGTTTSVRRLPTIGSSTRLPVL
jgi:hypothetical protein